MALNTVATQHKPQASDCANPFGDPFQSLGFNLNTPLSDQRGVRRDKKPDIGAYERRTKK